MLFKYKNLLLPMNLPIPSEEQLTIINHIKSGKYNGEVDAVAGSGKTTTILSLASHIADKSIIQITYNSELKREVSEKKEKYETNLFETSDSDSNGVLFWMPETLFSASKCSRRREIFILDKKNASERPLHSY